MNVMEGGYHVDEEMIDVASKDWELQICWPLPWHLVLTSPNLFTFQVKAEWVDDDVHNYQNVKLAVFDPFQKYVLKSETMVNLPRGVQVVVLMKKSLKEIAFLEWKYSKETHAMEFSKIY